MRDVSGYIESRQQLLSLKPSSRQNWLSMAIAHHMNGRPEVAAQVLGAYENVQEEVDPKETYEHSEMLLYKAQLLVDAKQLDEALEHLDSSRVRFCPCPACNRPVHSHCSSSDNALAYSAKHCIPDLCMDL